MAFDLNGIRCLRLRSGAIVEILRDLAIVDIRRVIDGNYLLVRHGRDLYLIPGCAYGSGHPAQIRTVICRDGIDRKPGIGCSGQHIRYHNIGIVFC